MDFNDIKKARLEPARRDAQKLPQNVFLPWKCGLSLLLVLFLAPRGFSPGMYSKEPLIGYATSKLLFCEFIKLLI